MIFTKIISSLSKRHTFCLFPLRSCTAFISSSNTANFSIQNLDGDLNGVVSIGFNKPETKNAIGLPFLTQMVNTLESIRINDKARVVILHSLVKGVFCAGADLKERVQMPDSQVKLFLNNISKTILDLQNLSIPTIAAIDGYALGGGLEISLACDLRISSSTAKMGLVETKLAIIPGGGGTQRLARIVGPAVAKELIFTGRIIDGEQAYKIGLVNHAVKQNENGDSAFQKSLEIAKEILVCGPIAVRLSKMAINKGLEVDLNSGLAFEQSYYQQTIGTKDRLEGLKAFKEKRQPIYIAE